MELAPFSPEDAATLSSWATSLEEARAWCSATEAPVPPDVIASWGEDPDVHPFAGLVDDDELVAYGELWPDAAEQEVELARLIVAPTHRGRGLGRELAQQLAERARDLHPAVVLRVRPDNAPALRCYLGAGFTPATEGQHATWNAGQPVPYVWLRAGP